ncbi:hypothetical protein [Flexivirga sp. B27]
MGQLRVDPGALDDVSATLRGAPDSGMATLARAVIDDLRDGEGSGGVDDITSVLPRLVADVAERTATIASKLSTAAGSYRNTEWLVRIALAEQS